MAIFWYKAPIHTTELGDTVPGGGDPLEAHDNHTLARVHYHRDEGWCILAHDTDCPCRDAPDNGMCERPDEWGRISKDSAREAFAEIYGREPTDREVW